MKIEFFSKSALGMIPARASIKGFKSGCLYVVDMGGRVKVGISEKPRHRVASVISKEANYGAGNDALGAWVSEPILRPETVERAALKKFSRYRQGKGEMLVGISAGAVANFIRSQNADTQPSLFDEAERKKSEGSIRRLVEILWGIKREPSPDERLAAYKDAGFILPETLPDAYRQLADALDEIDLLHFEVSELRQALGRIEKGESL